jgi:hypothetical protein
MRRSRHTRSPGAARSLSAAIRCALLLGLVLCGAAPADERFHALLADGTRVTGSRLSNADQAGESPALDDQPLGDEHNPLWLVRDTQRRAERRGGWLELSNGDVLPCEILGWMDSPSEGLPPHWIVTQQTTPVDRKYAFPLRVRADMVRRAVLSGEGREPFTPGLLLLRDGRRIETRSLRLGRQEVTALMADGVLVAGLGQLAEIHLPHQKAAQADGVFADAAFARALADDVLVRVITARGAELTFPKSLAVLDEDRRRERTPEVVLLAVRPSWALDTLLIDPAEVISRGYRRANETPLSLLNVVAAREQAGVHHLAWRRNVSVSGAPLAGGGIAADLGMGMHSHCELSFELPPQAKSFASWVALDRAAGEGGCARVKVFRDQVDGEPLWQSDFLRGSDAALRVGPLEIAGARRLVLVAEMAHEGRPAGADPLDIRDHVDWLRPMVEIDVEALLRDRWRLSDWVPQLSGWEVPEADRGRVQVRPYWSRQRRWSMVLLPRDWRALELQQRATIGPGNAFLPIEAAHDGEGKGNYELSLRVDGERIDSTMNGDLVTSGKVNEIESRVWLLSEYAGREVTLGLAIVPSHGKNDRPHGLLCESALLRPLVTGLPSDGKPLTPDVPLDLLQPTKIQIGFFNKDRYRPGKLSNGQPLNVRGYPFAQGFGVPGRSELVFPLDPSYRRFVAVVGLCMHSVDVGPFELLLDGEPHWTSDPAQFGRNTPAAQIDVPIPAGHRTLTLRTSGREGYGAWAQAGFMRRQ